MLACYFTNESGSVLLLSCCCSVDAFNKPLGLITNRLALHFPSALTVSLLYGAQQKPQTDYEKLRCPRPSFPAIIPTRPSPAHNKLRGSVWLLPDSLVSTEIYLSSWVCLMTDPAHYCTDKCHSSTLSFSFNQSLFFFCGGLRGGYRPTVYSLSKPEGWPHGASSCHHHSHRS